MDGIGGQTDKYRVILHRIGDNTEEEKNEFCQEISKTFGISAILLRKMVEQCPVVIKKDLPLGKAEVLAAALKSFGASVSVERKRFHYPISLEFPGEASCLLALESSCLQKSPGGVWLVIGRVINISPQELYDVWVLVQLFDELGGLIIFDETPLPINPLPAEGASPFKVIFSQTTPVHKVSIGFKKATGHPILAEDRREKGEWVEVNIPEIRKRKSPLPRVTGTEGSSPLPEQEPISRLESPPPELTAEDSEGTIITAPPPKDYEEPITSPVREEIEDEDLTLTLFDEMDQKEEPKEEEPKEEEQEKEEEDEENKKEEAELEVSLNEEFSEPVAQFVLKEKQPDVEEDLQTDVPSEKLKEMVQGISETISFKEELTQLQEGHPSAEDDKKSEAFPSYFWIEDFRGFIEIYDQRKEEELSLSFKNLSDENRISSPYQALLTILTYARFNQANLSAKALENTKKVISLLLREGFPLEEVPFLEGTPFFPGDIWRELFFRAVPKLKEVAQRIIEEEKWNAVDLDRLIRIIPHMSDRNSRWVLRFINNNTAMKIQIDFSNIPVYIVGSLYRVAARLGVVNPFFDYYQGINSMGDIKIQSFAREAFPDDPLKIEDPMARLGMQGEDGYCFPTQPQCEVCPLGTFCQRLYVDIDPSEKGMIIR